MVSVTQRATSATLAKFHTRTVMSWLLEMTCCPSGVTATALTLSCSVASCA